MIPLAVTGLVKRFPGFELALDFELAPGYVTGLVGANGSGKTTLIKAALGAVIPDAGRVHLLPREHVGTVFDAVPYPRGWRVGMVARYVAGFHPGWDEQRFQKLCARWEIPLDARVKELSRGLGMRLQLATALSRDARLLILDEPTAGLDPLVRDDLLETLAEHITDDRNTVLISTHITSDLEKIADYVAILDGGRLIEHRAADELHATYRAVRGGALPDDSSALIGLRQHRSGWEALVRAEDAPRLGPGVVVERPTLEEITIRLARRGLEARKER
ncbi:ABC transporter ATP-binding protein [Tessaracoccus sp. OH4464_COT-324]|uniref:ABC transporter ATP-binding protein n=1 Tax=Tessaracoccus sp. OH4464_COT-324 TaxID=2491059 RepID=UPI000F62F331|nr:ABC transporter ATP-binding protein [Tessaracoccus sp. OH4464_COT-324]RRD46478.1 ABC transporter ATP-binding protein [Tessaracoccus sp. OH4464_COT-324]